MAKKVDSRLILSEEDYQHKKIVEQWEVGPAETLGDLVGKYGPDAEMYVEVEGYYDDFTLKVQRTRMETDAERDKRVQDKIDFIERVRQAEIERQRKKEEKARMDELKKDAEWKEFQRLKKKFKGVESI